MSHVIHVQIEQYCSLLMDCIKQKDEADRSNFTHKAIPHESK